MTGSLRRRAALQWLRWRQGLRLRGVALALSMAGQAKLAERVLSGWRVCSPSRSYSALMLHAALCADCCALCYARKRV